MTFLLVKLKTISVAWRHSNKWISNTRSLCERTTYLAGYHRITLRLSRSNLGSLKADILLNSLSIMNYPHGPSANLHWPLNWWLWLS